MPYFIIVLGTAGSGKSSLTSMLYTYMTSHQLDAVLVNLDPAVDELPYEPDVDIREYVDARDIMRKTGLGPNGALIASIDMLLTNIEEIRDTIWSFKTNYIIIDTPGQMEVFAFRESGPLALKTIVSDARAVSLFLIDTTYALRASNFFSALLLSASTYVRIGYPQLNVLTKIDLISKNDLDKIMNMIDDPDLLADVVFEDKASRLLWDRDEVSSIFEKLLVFDIIPVSNVNGEGFDELYAALQRVLAGGEDYYTEESNPVL
ncbi:MAG: ATP/GTP-binding protein [Desulfurococcaceae archaeon]